MGKEEIRLIVNPTAAHGAVGREWPQLRSYIVSRGLVFRDSLTEAPGHATELAREAVKAGYGTVVAVGGDGTVNEVANGLVNGHAPDGGYLPPASLGLISRGTGCDLARTLGLRRVKDAVSALADREQTTVIDLGELTMERGEQHSRRLFVNIAGMGFDGEVVEGLLTSERNGRDMGGTLPYLLEVARLVVAYKAKHFRSRVDEERAEGKRTGIFACNGRFFGGGMKVAPGADVSDGFFDVVTIDAMPPLGLLMRVPAIYTGWHVRMKAVTVRRARELHVDTEDRLLVQADGELIGEAPATMRILPRALRVRV
ncbi:MAG: diacylglycerol/lipid kinase family protein [Anaerolineae bacterium]